MSALFLFLLVFFGYIAAYYTYGRFISRKVFKIEPERVVPSKQMEDGHDYVPTKRMVIFGHHFTSIAGTGPIVGPAIGVIWGWLPAVLWIFFGAVFMGAVHDFAALKISLRNQGKSISDITSKYISQNVRTLFFIIVFFSLLVVLAIFGMIIAIIFSLFPESVFPVWAQIPIAVGLGYVVYKRKGNLKGYTMLAVLGMYLTILIGKFIPLTLPGLFGIPATGIWTIILLGYAFIASTLPVTALLQPRDYINAWQLYLMLALLAAGIIFASLKMGMVISAPAFNPNPMGAPPMWPFLFITIACGAISGFHSLVASGTSAKQIRSEQDAQFVGYGAMLIESLLAIIVVIATTAGLGLAYTAASGEVLTGFSAWQAHYGSWALSAGLGSKIEAVVIGASNLLAAIGIPKGFGIVILGVFIASFAGTTLDSATRIQRYIITELFAQTKLSWMSNTWIATGIAVGTAAVLAFSSGADGKGALSLWPLFGSINQLLAVLALLVASVYLKKKGGIKWLVTGIPCFFMLVVTLWGAVLNQIQFVFAENRLLIAMNIVIFMLALAMLLESIAVLFKTKSGYKR
ncbi:carbon starvation protein A [Thermoproteota archaeon]